MFISGGLLHFTEGILLNTLPLAGRDEKDRPCCPGPGADFIRYARMDMGPGGIKKIGVGTTHPENRINAIVIRPPSFLFQQVLPPPALPFL